MNAELETADIQKMKASTREKLPIGRVGGAHMWKKNTWQGKTWTRRCILRHWSEISLYTSYISATGRIKGRKSARSIFLPSSTGAAQQVEGGQELGMYRSSLRVKRGRNIMLSVLSRGNGETRKKKRGEIPKYCMRARLTSSL